MAGNEILIRIRAQDDASKTFATVEKSAGGLSGALSKVGQVAGGFLAANVVAGAGQKLMGFFSDSISAARESREVNAQLEAVLKSTGMAAGVTADQARDLASALEKTSKFEDEAILGGESLLLTFTNIGKDVFPRATQTMVDMSQALGQDMKSSAIQLGKALNDPIAGVSALSRVGVSFTEDQKKVIASMVEAGDVAGAQAVILAELEKEFGGSAKAASDAAGAQEAYKDRMNDLQEQIGEKMIPIQEKLNQAKLKLVALIADKVIPILEELYAKHWPGVQRAINDVVTFIETNWPKVEPIFRFAFEHIKTQIEGFIQQVEGIYTVVDGVIKLVDALIHGEWSNAWDAAKQILQGFLDFIEGTFKRVFGAIPTLITDVLNGIIGKLNGFLDRLSGTELIPSIDLGPLGSTPAVRVPSLPRIPSLAQGGIATRPTLAVVGDAPGGEAIIPLNRASQMPAMAPTVNLYVSGSILSERDLKRAIREWFQNGDFDEFLAQPA